MTARLLSRRLLAIGLAAALALGLVPVASPTVVRAADASPPVGTVTFWTYDYAHESLEFRFDFQDPESGLASIAVSCDGALPARHPYSSVLIFKAMDPSAGGCAAFGEHTFEVTVTNGEGLGAVSFVSAWTEPVVRFEYPLAPRTGQPFTIQPTYSDGYTPPPTAMCRWEFRWGSTKALRDNEFDETFGGMLFEGTAADGYCSAWTFTLPWVPVPQYEVSFSGPAHDARSGIWPDRELIHATVSSTDRRIRESNLPLAQVLPSTYTPVVGQPVTYTRYLVGGADPCCGARWTAHLGTGDNPIVWERWTSSSTFTITPPTTGRLFVGWDRENPGDLLSAYYDPPVRRRDTTDPNTTAPVQRFRSGSTRTTVPVHLTWTGSDKGWGIASYRLQRSVNGGSWTTVSLPSARATAIDQTLTNGTSYRYRVRAKDKAGNVGSWDYGPTFKPTRRGDASSAIRYSASWRSVADQTAIGNALHETTRAGAAARLTFTGRDIAWIAERGPGHGKAKVYVDGSYITTVDLAADAAQPARLVFRRHWSTVGTHTIRIVGNGTTSRPLISVDGFAILR